TLSPGKMNERSIDDFLFRVRKGVCEHFSSAFGILARAAGILTRLVVGFQGGEDNKVGNFYSVTSQDGYAWNEYLDDDGLWKRIDVIDVVAPVRIQMGSTEYFQLPEDLMRLSISRPPMEESKLFLAYEFASFYFDYLNFRWTQWL